MQTIQPDKPHTVIFYESVRGSIISDLVTFSITAGLVLLADGRSIAWQVITISMFLLWIAAKLGMEGKVSRFYSKRELVEWAQSLPDDKQGGAA
jgi:hypothetical protein